MTAWTKHTAAALALLLAGCSGTDEAAAPAADASASPVAAPAGSGDTLVPGTDYHATATLSCTLDGTPVAAGCPAGVKRRWSEDGGALVEITKPDGSRRAIFTDAAGKPTGADSAEADGSAGWTLEATQRDDTWIVDFGPEHYEIPQALVTGG